MNEPKRENEHGQSTYTAMRRGTQVLRLPLPMLTEEADHAEEIAGGGNAGLAKVGVGHLILPNANTDTEFDGVLVYKLRNSNTPSQGE